MNWLPTPSRGSAIGGRRVRHFRLDLVGLQTIEMEAFDFGGNAMAALPVMPLSMFGPARPGAPGAPGLPERPPAPSSPSSPESPASPSARGAVARDSASEKDGEAPAAPVAAEGGPSAASLGAKALKVARNEIGVREEPKGSNRGPRVDIYQGGKGESWCCHFVSWCFEQSGQCPFGHIAWVEGLRRWAKSHGRYHPAASITPTLGDVFTMARYDEAGRLVGGHTGFVEAYLADRRVRTVEGNASDSVRALTRSLATLDGFVRL